MQRLIYDYLLKSNYIAKKDDVIAKNYIDISKDEIILSGNYLGLIELADYIINIALSQNNSHIHLDEDNFFEKTDKQLIIINTDE